MYRKIEEGSIDAVQDNFVVIAPNGEEFKGRNLSGSKDTLRQWWYRNGGVSTIQDFLKAFGEIAKQLTPNGGH